MPRPGRINLRQIEAFNAIMEAGSVTGGAELLCVSQPAVSRLLRDLEETIGFRLFERRSGRLVATVEAGALYEEVSRSFTGLEKIAVAAQEIRAFRAGSLRIAAMPAIALRFLPRVITRFSLRHPDVTISLQVRSSTKVADWVSAQQVDLGFAALGASDAGVRAEPLCRGALVAVLRSDHPLAGRALLSPDDLADERIVLLGHELSMRHRIVDSFAERGVQLISRIDVQLSAAVCEFVRAGAGVGLADPITAHELSGDDLALARFEPEIPSSVVTLFPLNRTEPIFLPLFRRILAEELARNPFVSVDPSAHPAAVPEAAAE